MKKWIFGFLLLLWGVTVNQGVQAQGSPFAPVVEKIGKKDGLTVYGIIFPPHLNKPPQEAVGDEELSRIMTEYAQTFMTGGANSGLSGPGSDQFQQVLNQLGLGNLGNLLGGGGGGIGGLFSGSTDAIDKELSSILGEEVSSIMNGLQDMITDLIGDLASQLLDASPIGEMDSLKDLLKEAYGKQQKIEYQQYKLNFEEKKSNTKLSTTFTKYYDALDLNEELKKIDRQVSLITTISNHRTWTAKERSGIKAALKEVSKTEDLEQDVNTVCNKNGKEVWMSEAERVKVLDGVRDQILARHKVLNGLRAKLTKAVAFRIREVSENKAVAGMFKNNSTLNRYQTTTKKSL